MARVTVEDCLEKEPNRFALVLLAAKRTKQLLEGARPVLETVKNKPVVLALREIATGAVRFMTDDDRDVVKARERRRKQEALARVSQSTTHEADDLFFSSEELAARAAAQEIDFSVDVTDDSEDAEEDDEKEAAEPDDAVSE